MQLPITSLAHAFLYFASIKCGELSNVLLFETSEKSRYTELSTSNKIQQWAEEQGLDKQLFIQTENSQSVKEQIQNAIELTEEYGVFTYPYVVIGENMYSLRVRFITMIIA